MGKSLPASAFKKLARLIADHAHGPSLSSALHGPALSASRALAGPCTFKGSASDPTQERIERRAYELWQRAGFPKGRDEEFEERAEKELREERSGPLPYLPRHRMGVRAPSRQAVRL
jgi:hypothetical protein